MLMEATNDIVQMSVYFSLHTLCEEAHINQEPKNAEPYCYNDLRPSEILGLWTLLSHSRSRSRATDSLYSDRAGLRSLSGSKCSRQSVMTSTMKCSGASVTRMLRSFGMGPMKHSMDSIW